VLRTGLESSSGSESPVRLEILEVDRDGFLCHLGGLIDRAAV